MHKLANLALVLSLVTACSGTPPKLGLVDGRLTPCDDPSHCVIGELTYSDGMAEAKRRLRKIVDDYGRTKFTADAESYWRVEFTSFLFRFVDDVEFLFAEPGKVAVRSGSRLGATDFGANRKRIDKIRAAFAPSSTP